VVRPGDAFEAGGEVVGDRPEDGDDPGELGLVGDRVQVLDALV
jgi:hypothetical protein